MVISFADIDAGLEAFFPAIQGFLNSVAFFASNKRVRERWYLLLCRSGTARSCCWHWCRCIGVPLSHFVVVVFPIFVLVANRCFYCCSYYDHSCCRYYYFYFWKIIICVLFSTSHQNAFRTQDKEFHHGSVRSHDWRVHFAFRKRSRHQRRRCVLSQWSVSSSYFGRLLWRWRWKL